MFALAAKALLSGMLIVAIAEIGKRLPTFAALVASLPLISVLGMVLLGESRQGRLLVVAHPDRPPRTRIISARPPTRRERQAYEEEN